MQELTADIVRIELTRRNAAVLEAKAAEERARLLALHAAAIDPPESPTQIITEPTGERVDPATVSNRELRERFAKEQSKRPQMDSPLLKPDTDGAEAWTPRAVRRRS